jgi:hypothetical protein
VRFKESHPYRSATLIVKCNESSSLVFDELYDWTNGEPTYPVDSPVDGGLLLPLGTLCSNRAATLNFGWIGENLF